MNAYVTSATIKRLREAKGMTQADLAQKLDAKRVSDAQAVLLKDAGVMDRL